MGVPLHEFRGTLTLVASVLFAPNVIGGVAGGMIGLAVLLAVIAPLFIWGKRRIIDASVRATPDGLYIYNGLKTHVVAWSDVVGFQPSTRPFLMAVTRRNGRPVPMDGITPESFGRRGPQEDSMRELEAYWRRVTGTPE